MKCSNAAAGAWYSTLIKSPDHAHNSVEWAINNYCNLKCKHCYMESEELIKKRRFSDREKKLAIAKSIVSEFDHVVISGGEPLLDRDLCEVVEYLAANNCRVTLATNGTRASAEVVQDLVDAGVSSVQISIDSHEEQSHDEFRGEVGCWSEAISTIKAFQAQSIHVSVAHTVHAKNYTHVTDLLNFSLALGVTDVYLLKFLRVGKGTRNAVYNMTDSEERELLLENLIPYAKKTAALDLMTSCPKWNILLGKTDRSSVGCAHGRIRFINYTGDVYSCPMVHLPIGTSSVDNLLQIESGSIEAMMDRSNLSHGDCASCPMLEHCGGCYAESLSAHGDQFHRGECWVYRDIISDEMMVEKYLASYRLPRKRLG